MNGATARRIVLSLAAPVVSAVVALVISAIVLEVSGSDALQTFKTMITNGTKLESIVDMLNRATPLYLSAVACAIGFRMNLFNIGVEGQYVLAAFLAAVVGAELDLWGPINITIILLVAMAVGAAWAGLAGLLKVTRGVNEVISTIMLNFIAVGGLVAALLPKVISDPRATNQGTSPLPASSHLPNLNSWLELFTRDITRGRRLTGVLVIAVVVGIIYHVVLNRSRFGFDIRASGMNATAAKAGGVPPKRMVLAAMIGGGIVAGLVGMPQILSGTHAYDQGFVQGLGFAGIAVALLGRNSAAGMAFAALLFGFLDSSAAVLQVNRLASREIVVIMQATILLVAVIAYQVVSRVRQRDEVRRAAQMTGVPA
ncbi:MAG TPA: ABC transporter permease [Ilumatobacter sp.]|nr:ABC transporter permease [Ilumatobacter sp.]